MDRTLPRSGRLPAEACVLFALLLLHGHDTWCRLRGPPPLAAAAGVSRRSAARVPIERAGEGVACTPAIAAAGCPRIGAARRLVLGGVIDLTAPTSTTGAEGPAREVQGLREALEALPGIGPTLARRIIAARPILDEAALGRVRGLGRRRARSLAPVLGLDGRRAPDICSLDSWPTTSSGCGKPR